MVAGTSTAIDKAALQPSVPADYDGASCPQGSASDIGASEFMAALVKPPEAPTNLTVFP